MFGGIYTHITITGKLGSGKSTICKLLAERYGYEIYSTGAIQREIAEKLGVDMLQMNALMNSDEKYDRMLDETVASISEKRIEDKIIFDSRMAWHFAAVSFKVFVTVDPLEAAKRVIAADRGSVEKYADTEEARVSLVKRSAIENVRFKQKYGVDYYDYRNYNLVIDSSFASAEEVAEAVYAHYNKYDKSNPKTVITVSPKLISSADAQKDGDILVSATENGFKLVSGQGLIEKAIESQCLFVDAKLI